MLFKQKNMAGIRDCTANPKYLRVLIVKKLALLWSGLKLPYNLTVLIFKLALPWSLDWPEIVHNLVLS